MTRSLSKQDGSTLAVVIATMAILMVTVAVAVEYTTNETRMVQRTVTLQNALAIGDSAVDVLFNSWRATCRTAPTTSFKTSDFALGGSNPVPTPSPFPNVRASNFVKRGTGYDPAVDTDYDSTYTISNYKVVAVNAEYGALANTTATPEPALGQLSGNIGSVTPTTAASFNYMASADVTLPVSFGTATNKNVVAKVRRVFSKQQQSPWNYAIFYVDPLEIHPGPLFTVTGWVHTNSDLYTGHVTLTFADKVTYGSDWFVGFMPGDSSHPETPGNPLYPNKLPPARDQVLQPFGLDSTSIFNTADANPNNDSYHELIEPPVVGSPDPLSTARYWNQAGIIIEVQDNGSASTKGFDGVKGDDFVKFYTVNSATGATTPLVSGPLYTMFSDAITTNQTIQDNREATSIKLATLDVSQIVQGGGTSNPNYQAAFNGIVYIHSISDAAGNRRGIRIKNGSRIPTAGLTIASNNAVYVQGDFNTGATAGTVPSNVANSYTDPNNPPNPQISTYTRAPTSILADAVNVLSNSWNDANSGAALSSRIASNTTVNAALVSGIVPTNVNGDGGYSGGAENFPRFLEDWSTSQLTYYGSMVELYKSKYSTGEWGAASYSPPLREWFFDNNFKITPPPGSLMIFSYNKGLWSVQ